MQEKLFKSSENAEQKSHYMAKFIYNGVKYTLIMCPQDDCVEYDTYENYFLAWFDLGDVDCRFGAAKNVVNKLYKPFVAFYKYDDEMSFKNIGCTQFEYIEC